MSRAGQANDRAAMWLVAQEQDGWSESDEMALAEWLGESDGNKAAYWRLKHSWREADRIGALGRGRGADGARAELPSPSIGEDEQVAMSPGQGFGSRGEPNLLMGGVNVSAGTERVSYVHSSPRAGMDVPRTSIAMPGAWRPAHPPKQGEGLKAPRFWLPAAIAASLLVVLGLAFTIRPWGEPTKAGAARAFDTPVGGRRTIALPDGSTVMLNTASRVRAAVGDGRREFWLERGEAYFEVAHDENAPFVVHAGSRRVTVLGTKFSVRRVGDDVAVSVLEGRVRVDEVRGDQAVRSSIIRGGDIARTSGAATLVTARAQERVASALAWREGMLSFDQTRLTDVAAEFNRYNIKPIVVIDAEAGNMRIGGRFPATEPDAFARLLHDAYGLEVEETADAIRVSN